MAELERLIGGDFLDAHLFTATDTAQLETQPDGAARIHVRPANPTKDAAAAAPPSHHGHDAARHYLIPADAAWLRALGVTNDRGQPREGMADKFRQIQKFAELLSHFVGDAFPGARGEPLTVADMGSGKGYLTFAIASLLGARANVTGIEARPALVDLCNRLAAEHGLAPQLRFSAGSIADAPLGKLHILIALHACDTATDDALARGIAAGATLLLVSPCCQKELRGQLTAPDVLADALRYGIFQERQAEFVTDALRAQLLEWAGYRTRVFEFISTEHTAKNLMIAGIKVPGAKPDPAKLERLQAFAQFYGIRSQALAGHLGVELAHANVRPAPVSPP
jgi:SAM-dependent methyltransferase